MEEKPLLQFYTDETWGYNCWDEKKKKQEGVSVKFQQEEDETREDFFKRLGFEPKAKMYGSDLEMDKVIQNENCYARAARVAAQGYALDILINDKDWNVRAVVAEQGYGLDVLAHDERANVRASVAMQGYNLDIFVHDENDFVRKVVAKLGYGLGILVHDEDWGVRQAVARQGYGLDVLAHDKREWVREAVEDYLEEEGYSSIEKWIEENPDKCADRKNRR